MTGGSRFANTGPSTTNPLVKKMTTPELIEFRKAASNIADLFHGAHNAHPEDYLDALHSLSAATNCDADNQAQLLTLAAGVNLYVQRLLAQAKAGLVRDLTIAQIAEQGVH